MPKIDEGQVEKAVRTCIAEDSTDVVKVKGIAHNYVFDRNRLEQHREAVRGWLIALPVEFQCDGGGGWSFLNACIDRDGEQWSSSHLRMEQLLCLGIGLGLASYLMPREMWDVLPGGMPYFVVTASSASKDAANGGNQGAPGTTESVRV